MERIYKVTGISEDNTHQSRYLQKLDCISGFNASSSMSHIRTTCKEVYQMRSVSASPTNPPDKLASGSSMYNYTIN